VKKSRNPLSSSTGTKVLIAVTGLALFGFLVTHLAGNLLVFAGPRVFNGYSTTLNSQPALVWALDLLLLAIVLLHAYKTVVNFQKNRDARPVAYHKKEWAGKPSRKSVASTTMIVSGLVVLVFVVLHLKHFKFGGAHHHAGGLYGLEMEVFSNPTVVLFYVLSMILIGFHLWHGFWSSLNSLGVNNSRYSPRLRRVGQVLATLIAGGFLIIPVWAYFFGSR
jgi:succinate dehydrogenase / fumarate reductase, cytochrome b subunit